MADWEVVQPAAKKSSIVTAAMADCEWVLRDLLPLTLKKIKLIEDFVAFGAVCKSWHKVFASNKRSLRQPQTPWLLLPEKKGEDQDHHRRILSLSKQNILRASLYIPELSDKRCISLNYGWVLTISSGEKGEMSLVHPLSRFEIELPPQTSIAEYYDFETDPTYIFTRRAALSADPSESPCDFVLMIIHSGGRRLGYWRPGDTEWKGVEPLNCFSDLTYYQNKFYAINYVGQVWSYKVSSHEPLVPTTKDYPLLLSSKYPYVVGVGNAGALLVLARDESEVYDSEEELENGRGHFNVVNYGVLGFQVYELDLIKGCYKKQQIKNIGDRAIFVGDNTSISLDHASQFPGVKSNHIYYTDDLHVTYSHTKEGGGKDMGSYDIQNGLTTPLEVEGSLSLINPPFWFMPSL